MTSNTALYYFNLFLNKKWVDKKMILLFLVNKKKELLIGVVFLGNLNQKGNEKRKKQKLKFVIYF
jgi:hypothetical protein